MIARFDDYFNECSKSKDSAGWFAALWTTFSASYATAIWLLWGAELLLAASSPEEADGCADSRERP